MKEIRFKLTEAEQETVNNKMRMYKFSGTMQKFSKNLLLQQAGKIGGSRKALDRIDFYDFALNELDEVLESDPILLRVRILEFKQLLTEKMMEELNE